jgi:hypothetical protein
VLAGLLKTPMRPSDLSLRARFAMRRRLAIPQQRAHRRRRTNATPAVGFKADSALNRRMRGHSDPPTIYAAHLIRPLPLLPSLRDRGHDRRIEGTALADLCLQRRGGDAFNRRLNSAEKSA